MPGYKDGLRAVFGALEETAPGTDRPEKLGRAARATMDAVPDKGMTFLMAQQALNYLKGPGTPLDEDGQSGSKTEAALRAFQATHHLEPDGKLGALTIAALLAATPVAIFQRAAKRLNPSLPSFPKPSLPSIPSPSSFLPKDPLGLSQASQAAEKTAESIAGTIKTVVLAGAAVAGTVIIGVFVWLGLKGGGPKRLATKGGRGR